jgi:hypothetical protein
MEHTDSQSWGRWGYHSQRKVRGGPQAQGQIPFRSVGLLRDLGGKRLESAGFVNNLVNWIRQSRRSEIEYSWTN